MKLLDAKIHGFLDYALALLFLILPSLLGFSSNAATLSYIVGVAYIGASIITKYPLGLIKLLPFPVHGVLETIMAISWLVFPFIFGFSDDAAARNFFIIAGIALLGVVAITNYRGRVVYNEKP